MWLHYTYHSCRDCYTRLYSTLLYHHFIPASLTSMQHNMLHHTIPSSTRILFIFASTTTATALAHQVVLYLLQLLCCNTLDVLSYFALCSSSTSLQQTLTHLIASYHTLFYVINFCLWLLCLWGTVVRLSVRFLKACLKQKVFIKFFADPV